MYDVLTCILNILSKLKYFLFIENIVNLLKIKGLTLTILSF